MSQFDFTRYDCLLISILTHGDNDHLCAYDGKYEISSIYDYFSASKCPTLAGKPKLFIIQACRGDNADFGMTLSHTAKSAKSPKRKRQMRPDSIATGRATYRIPNHADFLVAFSTNAG